MYIKESMPIDDLYVWLSNYVFLSMYKTYIAKLTHGCQIMEGFWAQNLVWLFYFGGM